MKVENVNETVGRGERGLWPHVGQLTSMCHLFIPKMR